MLESADYVEAIRKLRPDIVLGMGDVLFGHKPGVKRMDTMGDRTLDWVKALIYGMNDGDEASSFVLFAPILPIEAVRQSYYLDALQDELKDNVSGLVLYDTASVDAIPETLCSLPRLSLSGTDSPHQLLNAVTLGVDIFTIPFIAEATDAGIALDFSFPAHNGVGSKERLALGVDMWSSRFATDVAPLRADCQCYTCTTHHRAFLQHLLNAKEMLGWVLLQIHNHHIMHEFFVGVRRSIQVGSFEAERTAFERTYAVELPAKTGQGPRTRGYQFKSEGKGEARKNPKAFRLLGDGKEKLAEAALPSPTADAEDLEQQGFAQMAE